MQETDAVAFEKLIDELVTQIFKNSETVECGKNFENYYVKNCKSWAHCYQTYSGINTNMHIERLHK